MVNYRRASIPGASYFFTVALADRSQALLVDHIGHLRSVMRLVQSRHPFQIEAMVVLPDHLHAIWTLPQGDANFAMRWSLIKGNFSRKLPMQEHRSASRMARHERGIWQRRYWEHAIRGEKDMERHVDYIHYNPVKHGHVARAADWEYSSIHRFIRMGWRARDWGGDKDVAITVFE